MMYKFNEKTNNKQQQTAYVLYMIVGSYFHKSIWSNKVLEKRLHLHYREMPFRRQCSLEEQVIKNTEKELKGILPALAELNCIVYIHSRGGEYHLRFESGFEGVSVVVNREGNYRIQAAGDADRSLQMSA